MKCVLNLLAAAMIMFSCSTVPPVSTNAPINIKEIVKNPGTTLVDVRIPEQFKEKSAANAVNIPLATLEDHIDFFRKQKNIVVFCNSGMQAAQAVEILKKNGVQHVFYGKTLKNIEAIQNEK